MPKNNPLGYAANINSLKTTEAQFFFHYGNDGTQNRVPLDMYIRNENYNQANWYAKQSPTQGMSPSAVAGRRSAARPYRNGSHPLSRRGTTDAARMYKYDGDFTKTGSPTAAAYKRTRQEVSTQSKKIGKMNLSSGSRLHTVGGLAVAGGYMASAVGGSFLAGAGGAMLGGGAAVMASGLAFNAMAHGMRQNAINPKMGFANSPANRQMLKAANMLSSPGSRRITFAAGGMVGALGAGLVSSAFSSARNRMGGGLNNNRGNTF